MTPGALAALHAQCFTVPRPFKQSEFAELLGGPSVFLCTDATGFSLGRAVAGEAELLTIAVAPEARNEGLGRRLLAAFEAEAIHRSANVAFLEVAADNAPARRLYERAGYSQAGLRRAYYRTSDGLVVDALILRKVLHRT